MLLLYPDNDVHASVIDKLPMYNSTWIKHDQDVDSDGVRKKDHVHAVVSFSNPRSVSGVCKEFALDERWCQLVRNESSSLRYLLHADDDDKFQYPIDNVCGNVDRLRKTLILRRDPLEVLSTIFTYIDENFNANMRTVAKFCIENDCLDVYISKNMVIKNYLTGGK